MIKEEPVLATIVVADTDTLSTFIKRNAINHFVKLFSAQSIDIIVPKIVVDELHNCKNNEFLYKQIEILYRQNKIKIVDIEEFSPEYNTYVDYTENQFLGKGESAALSIAIHYTKGQACIASNNLSDVESEIIKHKLPLYTTATIIRKCTDINILSSEQASNLWDKMIENGEKLPDKTFSTYITNYNSKTMKRY